MGLDDAITYGAGMVMLFHGPPGTGKTMMANALANKLNKKVIGASWDTLVTSYYACTCICTDTHTVETEELYIVIFL